MEIFGDNEDSLERKALFGKQFVLFYMLLPSLHDEGNFNHNI